MWSNCGQSNIKMKIIVENICDIMGKWSDIIEESLGVTVIYHIAAIVY